MNWTTRSLYIPDAALASWPGVGVYTFEEARKATRPLPSFTPTGRAFPFHEVSAVAGQGAWWVPAVPEPRVPRAWRERDFGGVEALAVEGRALWTRERGQRLVRPSRALWWIPEAALDGGPNTPAVLTGRVRGAFPTLGPGESPPPPPPPRVEETSTGLRITFSPAGLVQPRVIQLRVSAAPTDGAGDT
jgi:hypothetical protein